MAERVWETVSLDPVEETADPIPELGDVQVPLRLARFLEPLPTAPLRMVVTKTEEPTADAEGRAEETLVRGPRERVVVVGAGDHDATFHISAAEFAAGTDRT